MLAELARIGGARVVVFDTRGNNGGDSGVGDRIFEAATGGLVFDESGVDKLPRTYAQWRVSEVSIATAERVLTSKKELYGATQPESVKESSDFLEQLTTARAKGEPWVEQTGGRRVTRQDIAQRNWHLGRFKGKVAIITNVNCASACLDFADRVLQVPGSIHLGQTTSSDTLYIDVGYAELPSHNRLFMPLKVWRNRLRGNNERLVPDVKFDIDMNELLCRRP